MEFKDNCLVLELGAGENPVKRAPNWHLHDVRFLPGLTHVFDLEHMFPIASESYDGLVARYVLEHISHRNIKGCISEIFRILKPGGRAVIITANLEEQCRALYTNVDYLDKFQDLVCGIFGDQDYPFNSHKSGLSPHWAVVLFKKAGFYEVEVKPIVTKYGPTDMTIVATKSKAVIEKRSE